MELTNSDDSIQTKGISYLFAACMTVLFVSTFHILFPIGAYESHHYTDPLINVGALAIVSFGIIYIFYSFLKSLLDRYKQLQNELIDILKWEHKNMVEAEKNA